MIVTDLFDFEFVPAKTDSDYLVIVLHGKGDSLKPFLKFNEELKLGSAHFLLLNAPRKYLDGYSWYGEPPFLRPGVKKIREKMLKLMEQLKEQGWDPKKIFLIGFSQGCLVSADLALHYPEKLGGVVGVSGYFEFFPRWKRNLADNRKTPWLLTHGTEDDVLPIETTKFGAKKLKQAGIPVEWKEMRKKHNFCDDDYKVIRRFLSERIQ